MSCFSHGIGRALVGLLLVSTSPWSTRAEGGKPRRLTRDGTLKLAPVVMNSAGEVVFAKHENPNLVALFRLQAGTGEVERLPPTVAAHQFDPAYSADGMWHCYAMSSGSPQLVLVIQKVATGETVEFRPREARATARNPSFLPGTDRIVFGISDVQGHQIASVNRRGEDLQYLTSAAGTNCWPACSPDGSRIAFGSSRDGNFEIYVMEADGSNVRRLTESPGRDMRPAWSPDGRRLAFVSVREGNSEVFVMEADGSNPRNITQHPGRDDYPAWMPDGRGVIAVSTRDGECDLFVYDVD